MKMLRYVACVAALAVGTLSAADRIANNALYYQPDIRVPMTSLTLVFHGGGSQQETDATAGLADVTADMLFRGTPTESREEIARHFELLGADVNASASETDFSISISCFSSTLDSTLNEVATIMKSVSFPQEELDLVTKQALNQIDASLENADGVLAQASEYVAYGGSRFGKSGSRSALKQISRKDVVRFWDKVRGTSILYFTSISNLPEMEIIQRTKQFTAGRKTDGFVLKPEEPYLVPKGREAYIVPLPDASNDRLRWSHSSIPMNDPRRFDLDLVLDALGSSQGLLFDVLRGKNGWCYGAYAGNRRNGDGPGRIVYYSDPTPETSAKLVPAMLKLIQTFPEDSEFQEMFARRNATFKNRYAYQLDPRFKLSGEVNRDRYGIPILSRDEYYAKIDNVSLASATRMVHDVFDTKNMAMVFYGDRERIESILKTLDPTIRITILDKEKLVQ